MFPNGSVDLGFGSSGFGSSGVVSLGSFAPGGAPPPVTPNGYPDGSTGSSGGFFNDLLKLAGLGVGAYQVYSQNDLANEALARGSSYAVDSRGRPVIGGGLGNVNLQAFLPWIIGLVIVLVLVKIFGGK